MRPFGRQIQTQHNHSPLSPIRQLYSSLSNTIQAPNGGDSRAGRLTRDGAPGIALSRPPPGARAGAGVRGVWSRPTDDGAAQGTAVGHGDRPQPPAGRARRSRAPWRCQAGSAVPSLVLGAVSSEPGLLPDGALRRAARRPGRPLRRWGTVRSARPVVRPRGASGGSDRPGRARSSVRSGLQTPVGLVWAVRSGAVRDRAPCGRSARGGPGSAGLLAAVYGGPVMRPGQRAPGELPARVHGPRGPQQRSASAHQAPGEP